MLESAWLYVGRIAFAWTVITLIGAFYLDTASEDEDALAMVSGVVGFVLWGVWTFGTLNIEVVEGSSTLTFTHPELTFLGVALALVPGYVALTGPINLIGRSRQPEMDDV